MVTKKGLLFLSAALTAAALSHLSAASGAVPAIYVFGDSTVDVGNNNFLPESPFKANFPPYGIDLPDSEPTGRFTNGYNGIDFFAKKLGFEKSPPPFLSISNFTRHHRGVSFASGGSGILDITGQNFSVSLNQQIRYFRRVSGELRTRWGNDAATRFFSKSLFYFSTASNDIFWFYDTFGVQNRTQQSLFVNQLARQFKNQLETLYALGARKFLVFGTSTVGCVPRRRLSAPGGSCLDYLNSVSEQCSRATWTVLNDLASDLKDFSFSFIKSRHFASLQFLKEPQYGFTENVSACCGSGRFNAESSCSPESRYCSNRDEYAFWDSVHPTQAGYKKNIDELFRGLHSSPLTVEELIRLEDGSVDGDLISDA